MYPSGIQLCETVHIWIATTLERARTMVRAAALSIRGQVRVKFDASGYFEHAIDREIVALACSGWRGDEALVVARYCSRSGEFPVLLIALEQVRSFPANDLVVELHGPDALRWVREHRIDVIACLESVLGRGSCDPEGLDPGPYWDDDPAWDCGYECRRTSIGLYQPC